jgi:hypothetical protein
VDLHRATDNILHHARHRNLAHRDMLARGTMRLPPCFDLVDKPGGMEHHPAELFELDHRIGDQTLRELVIAQFAPARPP